MDVNWEDSLALASYLKHVHERKGNLESFADDRASVLRASDLPEVMSPISEPLTLRALESIDTSSPIKMQSLTAFEKATFPSSAPSSPSKSSHRNFSDTETEFNNAETADSIGLKLLLKTALRDKQQVQDQLISTQHTVNQLKASNIDILSKSNAIHATMSTGLRWRLPCIIVTHTFSIERRHLSNFFGLWKKRCISEPQQRQSLLRSSQWIISTARKSLMKHRAIFLSKAFDRWRRVLAEQDTRMKLSSTWLCQQQTLRLLRKYRKLWWTRVRRKRLLRVLVKRVVSLQHQVHSRFAQWKTTVFRDCRRISLLRSRQTHLRMLMHSLHNLRWITYSAFVRWKTNAVVEERTMLLRRRLLQATLKKLHFHPLWSYFQVLRHRLLIEKPRLTRMLIIYRESLQQQRLFRRKRAFHLWKSKVRHQSSWVSIMSRLVRQRERSHQHSLLIARWKQWKEVHQHLLRHTTKQLKFRLMLSRMERRCSIVLLLSSKFRRSNLMTAFQKWSLHVKLINLIFHSNADIQSLRLQLREATDGKKNEAMLRTQSQASITQWESMASQRLVHCRRLQLGSCIRHWCRLKLLRYFSMWQRVTAILERHSKIQFVEQSSSTRLKVLAAMQTLALVRRNDLHSSFQFWFHAFRRKRLLRRVLSMYRIRRPYLLAFTRWHRNTFALAQQTKVRKLSLRLCMRIVNRSQLTQAFSSWKTTIHRSRLSWTMFTRLGSLFLKSHRFQERHAFLRWRNTVHLMRYRQLHAERDLVHSSALALQASLWMARWKFVTSRTVRARHAFGLILRRLWIPDRVHTFWAQWKTFVQHRVRLEHSVKQFIDQMRYMSRIVMGNIVFRKQWAITRWKSLILFARTQSLKAITLAYEETKMCNEIEVIHSTEYREQCEMELDTAQRQRDRLWTLRMNEQQSHLSAIRNRLTRRLQRVSFTCWFHRWNTIAHVRNRGREVFVQCRLKKLFLYMHHWHIVFQRLRITQKEVLTRMSITEAMKDQMRCERVFRQWRDRLNDERQQKVRLTVAQKHIATRTRMRRWHYFFSLWKLVFAQHRLALGWRMQSCFQKLCACAKRTKRFKVWLRKRICWLSRARLGNGFRRWRDSVQYQLISQHTHYKLKSTMSRLLLRQRQQLQSCAFNFWKRRNDIITQDQQLTMFTMRRARLLQARRFWNVWYDQLTEKRRFRKSLRVLSTIFKSIDKHSVSCYFARWRLWSQSILPLKASLQELQYCQLHKLVSQRKSRRFLQNWHKAFQWKKQMTVVALQSAEDFYCLTTQQSNISDSINDAIKLLATSGNNWYRVISLFEQSLIRCLQQHSDDGIEFSIRLFLVIKPARVLIAAKRRAVDTEIEVNHSVQLDCDIVAFGRGTIGECALRKEPFVLNVDKSHWSQSQNASQLPVAQALIPIVCDEECIAVIELIQYQLARSNFQNGHASSTVPAPVPTYRSGSKSRRTAWNRLTYANGPTSSMGYRFAARVVYEAMSMLPIPINAVASLSFMLALSAMAPTLRELVAHMTNDATIRNYLSPDALWQVDSWIGNSASTEAISWIGSLNRLQCENIASAHYQHALQESEQQLDELKQLIHKLQTSRSALLQQNDELSQKHRETTVNLMDEIDRFRSLQLKFSELQSIVRHYQSHDAQLRDVNAILRSVSNNRSGLD